MAAAKTTPAKWKARIGPAIRRVAFYGFLGLALVWFWASFPISDVVYIYQGY